MVGWTPCFSIHPVGPRGGCSRGRPPCIWDPALQLRMPSRALGVQSPGSWALAWRGQQPFGGLLQVPYSLWEWCMRGCPLANYAPVEGLDLVTARLSSWSFGQMWWVHPKVLTFAPHQTKIRIMPFKSPSNIIVIVRTWNLGSGHSSPFEGCPASNVDMHLPLGLRVYMYFAPFCSLHEHQHWATRPPSNIMVRTSTQGHDSVTPLRPRYQLCS